jgi:pyruvate dehydrogenase E2 component (dihydrolipoamide acetyltransferase)
MAEPVLMPQVGQDIKTATIVEWLKKENEPVEKGEVIATVESDKAAFDVEAYTSGVLLKILHAEGQEVEVLTPIGFIGQPGERVAETATPGPPADVAEAVATSPAASTATAPPGAGTKASPAARRLARERGISLETITGTGPGGRITKEDVLAAAAPSPDPTASPGTAIPFSSMRARIAERLTRSKQTIPHFYISMDVDMTEAMVWRRRFNESEQVKVTVTDMIVKATAVALSDYAQINAHVEADKIILQPTVNVGVAVSVADGLIVPVIADADKRSLAEVGAASRANAEAARAGRLKPQAIGGFTVTNLGMHAVDTFVPVINPPEAAILAVGAVAPKPAVVGGAVVARDLTTMTLACDHRAVDGAYAAQFLGRIKEQLENPALLEEQA